MIRIAIYQDGRLTIPGENKIEDIAIGQTKEDFIIIVPRKYFLIDKITLPEIALEDSEDAALYQAIRIFGREDLKACLLPIDRKENDIECLIIAIDLGKISEIESLCKDHNIPAVGISMATIVIAEEREVDGLIIMDWEDHIEALVTEKRRIKELYMIPKKETTFLKFLENMFSERTIRINLSDLSGNFRNISSLFEINTPVKATKKNLLIRSIIFIAFSVLIGTNTYLYKLNSLEKRKFIKLEAQFSKMRNMEKRLLSLQKEYKDLENKAEFLQNLVSGIEPIHLLATLSKILPKGTIIKNYRFRDKKVTITGYTPSVSTLIENLGKVPFIENLKILSSSTRKTNIEGRELERFSISFNIRNQKAH